MLGSLWGEIGVTLGVTLGSLWGHFGVTLNVTFGSPRGHFRGDFRVTLGVTLGAFLACGGTLEPYLSKFDVDKLEMASVRGTYAGLVCPRSAPRVLWEGHVFK